ncbi:MAG: hypothetical protein EA369_09765 [Bradymonadales bacterium]|nr:MAG: hypothetical protein EA369_09765 [Bradymonadales bacterium]
MVGRIYIFGFILFGILFSGVLHAQGAGVLVPREEASPAQIQSLGDGSVPSPESIAGPSEGFAGQIVEMNAGSTAEPVYLIFGGQLPFSDSPASPVAEFEAWLRQQKMIEESLHRSAVRNWGPPIMVDGQPIIVDIDAHLTDSIVDWVVKEMALGNLPTPEEGYQSLDKAEKRQLIFDYFRYGFRQLMDEPRSPFFHQNERLGKHAKVQLGRDLNEAELDQLAELQAAYLALMAMGDVNFTQGFRIQENRAKQLMKGAFPSTDAENPHLGWREPMQKFGMMNSTGALNRIDPLLVDWWRFRRGPADERGLDGQRGPIALSPQEIEGVLTEGLGRNGIPMNFLQRRLVESMAAEPKASEGAGSHPIESLVRGSEHQSQRNRYGAVVPDTRVCRVIFSQLARP